MFENGVPKPIWGDAFLAAGLATLAYELYKIATIGLDTSTPAIYVDVVFFVVALVLLSMGSSMKQRE